MVWLKTNMLSATDLLLPSVCMHEASETKLIPSQIPRIVAPEDDKLEVWRWSVAKLTGKRSELDW